MSFRPLIGVNFYKLEPDELQMSLAIVSVPLSGLTSINTVQMTLLQRQQEQGFRPLIGVNFYKP